jgi:uncharacterized protein YwqG
MIPERDALKEKLKRLIIENRLESMAPQLIDAAKFSVRLMATASPEGDPTHFDSFGGAPELPASLSWPSNRDGRPLMFLGQIQLSRLAGFSVPPECPRKGRLYFFCDGFDGGHFFGLGDKPETRHGWRVLYEPDESLALNAVEPPDQLYAGEVFPCFVVTPTQDLTIPATRSIELTALPEMDQDTWERFYKLRNEIGPDGPRHRMFGHPDAIQGCMQRMAQFISNGAILPQGVYSYYEHPRAAELMPGAHDWILLLQIDSAKDFACWGDWGSLYFWIKRSDLAECRFQNAWFFMQCG